MAKFLGVFANSLLEHAKLCKIFNVFEYEQDWKIENCSKSNVYHDSLLHSVWAARHADGLMHLFCT